MGWVFRLARGFGFRVGKGRVVRVVRDRRGEGN